MMPEYNAHFITDGSNTDSPTSSLLLDNNLKRDATQRVVKVLKRYATVEL